MTEEVKQPKRGIGTVVRERLIAGDTNAAVLEAVKAAFPESSTTSATISWHRNDLRKEGNPHKVPTAAEANKRAEAADPLD